MTSNRVLSDVVGSIDIRKLILIYMTSNRFLSDDMVCLMVFNTSFNNISVISWQSVLLVEETGGPGENH
jgi:hypothetical protein